MIDQETLDAIIAEPSGNFIALAQVIKANPYTTFVGMNLSGCDFSGCVLADFNFSRCDMRGIKWDDATDFTGAKTMDATFDEGVRGTLKGVPVEKLFRLVPMVAGTPEVLKAPTAVEALAFFRRTDRQARMARLMMQAPSGAWEWVLK